MSLLFSEPLIAGLNYREDMIGVAEERGLIERLSAEELTPFRFKRLIRPNKRGHIAVDGVSGALPS